MEKRCSSQIAQDSLLDLAREGPLGREEQVLGELLGDGRAALDDGARRGVANAARTGRADRRRNARRSAGPRSRPRPRPAKAAAHRATYAPRRRPRSARIAAVLGEHGDIGGPVVERGARGIGHPRDEIGRHQREDRHAERRGERRIADRAGEPGMAPDPSLQARRPAPRALVRPAPAARPVTGTRPGAEFSRRAFRSAARPAWCSRPDRTCEGSAPMRAYARQAHPRCGEA